MYLILCIVFIQTLGQSQSNDMLELRSDGIQIPIVDHTAVNNPVRGMMVYETTTDSYWYFDGTTWQNVGTKSKRLIDNDEDTAVYVEFFPDSDEITFDVRGRTALEIREIPGPTNFIQYRIPETNGGNMFFGNSAGSNITTVGGLGFNNTVLGMDAGSNLSTGYNNLFMGAAAGDRTTTSEGSTYVGALAGNKNETGVANTAIGAGAGRDNVLGSLNVYVGFNAGAENLDSGNTFVGESVGFQLKNGGNNTLIGTRAANQVKNGLDNVYLGVESGANNEGGDRNVFIGFTAGSGYGLSPEPAVSDVLAIANSATTSPLIYGEFNNRFVRINDILQLAPIPAASAPTCMSPTDEGFIYFEDSMPQKLKVCVQLATPTPSWGWQDLN